MSYRLKITGLIFAQLFWVCFAFGQTKQGWLSKNWHNMNARYNGLYHANELLNQSIKSIQKRNVDDYNDVISVFPYGTPEQASSEKSNLEEVYKKASKVIRKHPKSRWVDDGWFMVGKSYFFQHDAYLAIETFQYVINQYPDGEQKYDAKLWIVKAYIQQEKYYDAEAIMGLIVQKGDMPKRLNKEMAAVSAEIFIKEKKYNQAIQQLQKALNLTKNRDERSRYHFILGQLYLKNDNVNKAKEHFAQTIKLNPPYELAFQSNLGLITAISLSQNKSLKTPRKHLKKMLKDDKNIEYYDQIYYQLANLELRDKNKDGAIENYRLSAKHSIKNKDQKANSYLALATIFFEDKNYKLSQKYFDSTAMFMSEKRADYELIKAKQLVLTDLIENLVNIFEQDSLLALTIIPKDELDKLINEKIRKQKEIEDQAARDKANNLNNVAADPFNQPKKINQNPNSDGQWYFYNPSAVGRGNNDFKRKWGDRPLADNWRMTSLIGKNQTITKVNDDDTSNTDPKKGDPTVYNPANDKEKQNMLKDVEEGKRQYYEKIPFSTQSKEAANNLILKSLFYAGKIYEEDLKEYSKAKGFYLDLLKRYPASIYEAETYFHLHRIASLEGNEAEMAKYSELLNTKYAKSPFNLVINNREVLENMNTEKEVSKLYVKAYDAYQAEKYDEAISYRNEANKNFAGNALQAKFDYLQALIIGKTKGEEAYVAALKIIKDNYPGTTVANTAAYTIELLEKKKNTETTPSELAQRFAFEPGAQHFFISVYDGGNATQIQAAFSEYNAKQHGLDNLKLNSYALGNKNIVSIQSFKDKETAEKYYIEFIKNDQFFKALEIQAYENYTISANNFRILLKDQSTDSYSEFFFNNYIQ